VFDLQLASYHEAGRPRRCIRNLSGPAVRLGSMRTGRHARGMQHLRETQLVILTMASGRHDRHAGDIAGDKSFLVTLHPSGLACAQQEGYEKHPSWRPKKQMF
jgi:hypothetical protein